MAEVAAGIMEAGITVAGTMAAGVIMDGATVAMAGIIAVTAVLAA